MKKINFHTLNRAVYKRLVDYFEYQIIKRHHSSFRTKKLIKNLQCKQLSSEQIKQIKNYYTSFGFKNINTEWHRFYTHVSGKFFKEYIPVEFFINVIEPYLNMKIMHPALTDKNLLDRLFLDVRQPKAIIKNINGIYYDGENNNLLEFENVLIKCREYKKMIIKPSIDSGGGKNIIAFKMKENLTDYNNMSVEEIIYLYKKNFIIQDYFIQHEQMSKLNPSSVNTLRIQSLFIENKVEILTSIVRIGGKGSIVDNASSGGYFCNISKEGVLNRKGYYGTGEFILETDTNIKFEGFRIPNFINILEEVKSFHLKIPYFKLVAWDIAVNIKSEAVLIEYNPFVQMMHHQFATGPLFGKFTEEILSKCTKKYFFKLEFRDLKHTKTKKKIL